jgi:hypothetical protein
VRLYAVVVAERLEDKSCLMAAVVILEEVEERRLCSLSSISLVVSVVSPYFSFSPLH